MRLWGREWRRWKGRPKVRTVRRLSGTLPSLGGPACGEPLTFPSMSESLELPLLLLESEELR